MSVRRWLALIVNSQYKQGFSIYLDFYLGLLLYMPEFNLVTYNKYSNRPGQSTDNRLNITIKCQGLTEFIQNIFLGLSINPLPPIKQKDNKFQLEKYNSTSTLI